MAWIESNAGLSSAGTEAAVEEGAFTFEGWLVVGCIQEITGNSRAAMTMEQKIRVFITKGLTCS